MAVAISDVVVVSAISLLPLSVGKVANIKGEALTMAVVSALTRSP